EALRHARDHVRHQRAREAVQGTVLALVVGTGDDQVVTGAAHDDVLRRLVLQLAVRTLHDDPAPVDRDVDAARDGNWLLADTRHSVTTPDRGPRRPRGARAPHGRS